MAFQFSFFLSVPKGYICEGDIGDKADDDFGYLFQKPSDAVSGSVPKGHVGHLNDLVPVGRGKPFRVKSIYEKREVIATIRGLSSRFFCPNICAKSESKPKCLNKSLDKTSPKKRVFATKSVFVQLQLEFS